VHRLLAVLWLALLALAQPASAAPKFPELTGRVVDGANLLSPSQVVDLTSKSEALEARSGRQLVVATLPSLDGLTIEDYGYQLGRHWGIGQSEANNGVILLVALTERKVRIEVGYGLEGIVTDALSNRIIQSDIVPRFRESDYPGGIMAGANAIIEQLQAPPELAEQRALEAAAAGSGGGAGGSILPLVFWIVVLGFILVPLLVSSGFRGRKYRGRRRGSGPIVIWGPGMGGWSGGSSGSSGWSSGGGGGWSGGGGGFSGGGGSFGGGGASGGW
jgi:uncharacterized protein